MAIDQEQPAHPAPLLTRRQVAELLGVEESTLVKWETDGAGPPVIRLGHRTVRYRPADVERWLDECAAQSRTAG